MHKNKNKIKIGNRVIGQDYLPLVIAEIGINHEGSMDKAIKMVDDAYDAGCECVKFQCHVIDDEMIDEAKNVIPGNANESIWEIMNRCKLTEKEDIKIKEYVDAKNMIYLSTPFSRAAAEQLEKMDVLAYKIGSGECNNYPLIEHIAKYGKPIILSTGMNDLVSVEKAVTIIRKYNVDYALLHCTSMYPTPYNKVRLNAMTQVISNFSDAVVGLSDHSIGNYTCFGAVSLGASILEKHFTSDKKWLGPDISISINPLELQDLIIGSQAVYKALDGAKTILKEEQPTIEFAYASVVAIKDIKYGEQFSYDNIWVKRPGTGDFLAGEFEGLIGKKANCDIKSGVQIKQGMFNQDV